MRRGRRSSAAGHGHALLGAAQQGLGRRRRGGARRRPGARQQRADQLEGRVLGRGTDEDHGAVFDKGRKASCWARLKRWISSTKARCPGPSRGASSPPRTPCADRRPRRRPPRAARRRDRCRAPSSRAIVVLPQPGGPHRIIEASCRLATMRPIGPPAPTDDPGRRCRPAAAAAAGRPADAAPLSRTACSFGQSTWRRPRATSSAREARVARCQRQLRYSEYP